MACFATLQVADVLMGRHLIQLRRTADMNSQLLTRRWISSKKADTCQSLLNY